MAIQENVRKRQSECERAIQSVNNSEMAFCKFLSANDSGETGGHQVGILVSMTAKEILFTDSLENEHIKKRLVKINWDGQLTTNSTFTWYKSKNELRITRFGRGFELLNPERTGSLFVFTKQDDEDYTGFFLDTEEDINGFLGAFGMAPTETNSLIKKKKIKDDLYEEHQAKIELVAKELIERYKGFPSTKEMAYAAHKLSNSLYGEKLTIKNPDKQLINWTNEEYLLFRTVEFIEYGELIKNGFSSMENFIGVANTILNRRKSRAGKSLENHLERIFDYHGLRYTAQARTEKKKTPDFIFPSIEDYHNFNFPADKLTSLAAKTTCKDRWRQIITEAERIPIHHLCTLQQGISEAQMNEMEGENVILVVPKPYISSYPKKKRDKIWTVSRFIDYVKEKEK